MHKHKQNPGFTIVELLVVIVVIGILATIIIISFTGISQKATAASLQSDLKGAKTKLQMYQVEYGSYPTDIAETPEGSRTYCPAAPSIVDNRYCFSLSPGNTLASVTPYTASTNSFSLNVTSNNNVTYVITDSTSPALAIEETDPDWQTIGTQIWAKSHLNVGTMVTGMTEQTDNATLEKYCYDDIESNCTDYGAFYQWNEAMQYATAEGSQGICPAGSHIPSDNDWKILETQLGMIEAQIHAVGPRGTDQGTQIKPGGTSGLNIPLVGYRHPDGTFNLYSLSSYLWSSTTQDGTYTRSWRRGLTSDTTVVFRYTYSNAGGFSVRCLKN